MFRHLANDDANVWPTSHRRSGPSVFLAGLVCITTFPASVYSSSSSTPSALCVAVFSGTEAGHRSWNARRALMQMVAAFASYLVVYLSSFPFLGMETCVMRITAFVVVLS